MAPPYSTINLFGSPFPKTRYLDRSIYDAWSKHELETEDLDMGASVVLQIDTDGEGVHVQAPTFPSLKPLLDVLTSPEVNIPVIDANVGPVSKNDVVASIMVFHKKKEFAVILAFGAKVNPEASEYADEVGVKIFSSGSISHLVDQFKAYAQSVEDQRKKAPEDGIPCVLRIVPECGVLNKKDPIVLCLEVIGGVVKVGTTIRVPSRDFICIGKIASIERNHLPDDIAYRGAKVVIRILGDTPEEQQILCGRDFKEDDELVGQLSRESRDIPTAGELFLYEIATLACSED